MLKLTGFYQTTKRILERSICWGCSHDQGKLLPSHFAYYWLMKDPCSSCSYNQSYELSIGFLMVVMVFVQVGLVEAADVLVADELQHRPNSARVFCLLLLAEVVVEVAAILLEAVGLAGVVVVVVLVVVMQKDLQALLNMRRHCEWLGLMLLLFVPLVAVLVAFLVAFLVALLVALLVVFQVVFQVVVMVVVMVVAMVATMMLLRLLLQQLAFSSGIFSAIYFDKPSFSLVSGAAYGPS